MKKPQYHINKPDSLYDLNLPKYLTVLLCITSLLILSECKGASVKDNAILNSTGNETALSLLKDIEEINKKSPDSFTLDIDIDGRINNKNFKATGSAIFNKDPVKLKITFFDAIFRSPLTVIVQDEEIIKFFFPVEKTLYIDNINKIKLKNYAGINMDYCHIFPLATGRIPLLDDYTVKNAFTENKNDQLNNGDIYIILENKKYYETIVFKGDMPDKILFLNKETKEKTEMYLENPHTIRGTLFYRKISLISANSDFRIINRFKNIKLNNNPDIKKIVKIDLPKGYKTIYTP